MTESRKRLTVLVLAVLLLVTLTARRTVWQLRPRPGSVPQLTVPRPSEVDTRMPERRAALSPSPEVWLPSVNRTRWGT